VRADPRGALRSQRAIASTAIGVSACPRASIDAALRGALHQKREPQAREDLGFVVEETVSRVLFSRPSPARERRSFI